MWIHTYGLYKRNNTASGPLNIQLLAGWLARRNTHSADGNAAANRNTTTILDGTHKSIVDLLDDVIVELKYFIFGAGVVVLCSALFQLQQVNYAFN